MKFFVALLALVAVASALEHHKPGSSQDAQLQAIIDAINHPNTDPATAALLQEQLNQILGSIITPEVISPGLPTLVDEPEPIWVGPVIVDDSIIPAPVNPSPVVPSPVVPESGSPLVQIIVNVKQAEQLNPDFVGGGVVNVDMEDTLTPELVNVVEQPPETVNVVDQAPETVIVAEQPSETINVVQPVLPGPVVNLPDELN